MSSNVEREYYEIDILIDKRWSNYLILISFSFVLLTVMAFVAIEYPVDDAFIVFRYADRAMDRKGLTFNNQEYVEGYTSRPWTLLLTLLSYTGLNLHLASLLTNYIFILLPD
jgi:hypothetical protein